MFSQASYNLRLLLLLCAIHSSNSADSVSVEASFPVNSTGLATFDVASAKAAVARTAQVNVSAVSMEIPSAPTAPSAPMRVFILTSDESQLSVMMSMIAATSTTAAATLLFGIQVLSVPVVISYLAKEVGGKEQALSTDDNEFTLGALVGLGVACAFIVLCIGYMCVRFRPRLQAKRRRGLRTAPVMLTRDPERTVV
mmetsp:Transcript_30693/g.67232  ORF Transcript_30693/g.67232 Transcript_30693/m.67232 type:complete len:197 (+) Transcript_30693:256-846(+)